ncbi:MAG TPA: Ig-like domain-containing protein [Acidobacteriaceae bacterium]
MSVFFVTALTWICSPALASAQTTVTPTSVTLPSTVVNEVSAASSVTLKNTQATALTISTIAASGNFAVSSTTCPLSPATLGALLSCKVFVTFSPVALGLTTGSLSITHDAANSPNTVPLTGTGVNPTTLSVTAEAFGSVAVGETSAIKHLTLKNNQLASLTLGISSITPPAGGYAVDPSTTCGGALAAGASCTIALTFTPAALGAAPAGSLAIVTTTPSQSLSVALTGTGVNPTTLSATAVSFYSVVVGETSAIHTFTLKNNQLAPFALGISSITAPAGGYALAPSTTCGGTLAGGATCTVALTFTPAALGAAPAGSLAIVTTNPSQSLSVALTGTGVNPTTLSAAAEAFGSVAVGESSAIKSFTLKNNQLAPFTLGISSITPPAGGYALAPSTTCGGTLAAGASCTIALTFTPAALGAAPAGSLAIVTTTPSQSLSVALTGTGVNPTTLSATAVAFYSVVVGETSAIHTFTLKNNQLAPFALGISSITPPAGGYAVAPSTTCGGTLAGGASCTIALTFTPAALGAAPAGSLAIVTTNPSQSLSVALTGTGVNPTTLSAAAEAFGSVAVGETSAIKSFTLKNNQLAPLTLVISSITPPAGGFAVDPATTCGGSLAGGATCTVALTFTPAVLGPAPAGSLAIITTNPAQSLSVALTGTGVNPTTISATTEAFGNVVAGEKSIVKSFTLKNNQLVPLTLGITSITAPAGGYAIDPATTCGSSLAPGAICTVSLTFTPAALGVAPAGSVALVTTNPSQSLSVPLTGTGIAEATASVSSLAFGNVAVGAPSVVKSFALKNNQAAPLGLVSITPSSAMYNVDPSTTCGTTLAVAATCTVGVTLTPASLGAVPATNLVITTNAPAPNAPISIAMTGNGVAPVTISPTSIAFAAQLVGTTSTPARTVKVTNVQATKTLHITGTAISGANSSDFAVTNPCANIAPATSCTLPVTFTPSLSGARTATLTIQDDSATSPHTVALSGNGNAPVSVTPLSITNFTAPVGSTSTVKTVTIKNNDATTALVIGSFQLTGDYTQASTSCGTPATPPNLPPYSLAPGASCILTLQFAPTIGGTRTGQLQVNDSALTSPQVINLSGIGTSPLTVLPTALIFPAQPQGTTSTPKSLVLTNHESQPETFALNLPGDYTANSSCSSGTINANSTCTISVSFAPSLTAGNGPDSGTLSIPHSAAIGSPLAVSLTGSVGTPQAAVAEVQPGVGGAGTSVPVVITGNGFTHFTNSSVITFVDTDSSSIPSDITVTGVSASSSNVLHATLVIGANAVSNLVTFGARNITVKSGSESAFLNSAFTIFDPDNMHDITVVNPGNGAQGQTLNVALAATGTHFIQGTTFVNFGTGITINSLTITDPTDAVANISISNTTTVGPRTITMVTGGEYASSTAGAFQVTSNGSTLVSVSPNVEPQSFAGTITLTATGTHFQQNATQVSISGGVIVGDVQVTSATTATAEVALSTATPGTQDVTVSTGGEIETLPNSFTVTGSTPALLSVAPTAGTQGQSNLNVVITGNAFTNFSTTGGASMLADFTGQIVVNSITVNNPHQATVNISINQTAPTGGLTARLTSTDASNNVEIFPFSFTVNPSNAAIVSVVPNNVPQGGQVTLVVTGVNTIWNQPQSTSQFYPEIVPTPSVDEITVNSPTSASLNISVPSNTPPGNYPFYIATGGQIVNATIHVYANTPSMMMTPANGLVPNSGVNTFNVTFNGQFTTWSEGNADSNLNTQTPVVAGAGVTVSNFQVTSALSATATIMIAAGAATTSRLVTITTGPQTVTTYFNVTSKPVAIISVSPPRAPQNTTLNVGIVGLNTHFCDNVATPCPAGVPPSTVLFGPEITVNSVSVQDNTHLTANITTAFTFNSATASTQPGYQTVYVDTGNEQVTGSEQVLGAFSVDPPASPTLLSVVPSSAPQGSTENVTITGSLTHWCGISATCPNPTEAILGAGVTVSNLAITSATTATATIAVSPTAPVGGNSVTMITGTEIVGGVGFSVTPSAAYIQSVGPTFTCNANGLEIANFCNGGSGSGVPYEVGQLQTTTLNVVGVGTHWLQGDTTFNFGGGVIVDLLTITSPTTATVQITVLSNSPVGYASLTTYTDGESVTLQQAIDIEEGFPKLLAISPNSGEQGATVNIQVLGRFTHFGPTTNVAFNETFPGEITVNSFSVADNNTMTVNATINVLAYVDYTFPCGHVLTITTGGEQVSTAPILDNLCVQTGAAQINSVSAPATPAGSTGTLTIVGSATHFEQGVTAVSFGDSSLSVPTADIVVTSPTTLTATFAASTSATPGFKTVTVSTFGEVASQQFAYTVIPNQATLTEANPNQAQQGAQLYLTPAATGIDVKLTGQYSHFSSLSTATFGAGIVVNSVTQQSATQITANITIDPLSYAGGRTVTVTTPGVPCSQQPAGITYQGCAPGSNTGTGSEIVSANAFTITTGPAIISQVAPNTGNEGQEIVFNITGNNTHWQQNFTQFYIAGGGSDLTIHSVIVNSPTSATVDMNISPTANPGARSIFMGTAGETLTDSGAFVVTGGVPAIAYISPGGANTGDGPVEVTIHGIYTLWAPGTTTLHFGPGVTVSSYQVDDNFNIEAVLGVDSAATLGYHAFTAITGNQVLTGNFLVSAAPGSPGAPPPPTPIIWYETPSTALPGQTLNVSFAGLNTHWDPNAITGTQFSFGTGIQVNTCQVLSETSALCNLTVTATTAQTNLVVFTTGTETESANFNVVIAQPELSVVDPGSGLQGGTNINVNIIGQYTTFDNTTTFSFGPGITVNGPPVILGPTIATQSISIDQLAQTGGRSVVASTPDAAPIAQTVSGAGFTVTRSLALIAAINPNISAQGTTIAGVVVTGQNTHWNGSTIFQFGSGITVTSTNVTGYTSATLTLSIPALASEGPTYVSATTGGEVASINNGFVITAGTPYLLSSGPGSLPQQSSATFTILAQQTSWSAATPPTISYGAGVVLTNVNVTSPQSLTVSGYVMPTTPVGYRSLTVTNGSQVLGLSNVFYVSPGPAVVNSVAANTAGQGATLSVQITGTNTNWQNGVTTLSFPGVLVNSFVVNSSTLITANITVSNYAPAGQVSVTATTGGEVATGINVFNITQTQPELLAVVPSSGPQGWTTQNVTLTGDFTHFSTANSVANFGAGVTVNSVTASSATSLIANVTVQPTANLGYRNVTVITGTEGVSLTNAFRVTLGPAAISGLNPAIGAQNTTVNLVVTGSQTHFNGNGALGAITTASFGGGITVTNFSVTDASHANVTVSIPSSTPVGSYNVTLTTGGEVATILGGFSVGSGNGTISNVNPPTGHQGDTNLSVALTGLLTSWVNGTSVANFGAGITVNSLAVIDATHATASITISQTASISSRTITVTTNGQTASIVGGFSVLAGLPSLVSTTPSSAQAGATANIVVNGAFTSFTQGTSTVGFGSGVTVNTVTVNSTTMLTANITVAANASVGARNVNVTTGSENVTLSNGFNVLAGTPVITQINPNIGTPNATVVVTINGQYTNWVNGTTTASFGTKISVGGAAEGTSGPVVVNNATTLTATLNIDTAAALGPRDVVVTTGGEVDTVPAGFTVQPTTVSPPTVISLSPGAYSSGMSINGSITAVFSQPMGRPTITTSDVLLYLEPSNGQSGEIPITGTVTLDAAGRVVTFTPSAPLAVNSSYYFEMTNAVKDASGNALSTYAVYIYTTFAANTAAPTVIAANPPANATVGTNAAMQLEFSASMNQSTQAGFTVSASGNPIAGAYSWNAAINCNCGPGTIATFTPSATLTPGTVYTVSYGAPLVDVAGNALTPGSFTFTAGSAPDTTNGSTFVNFTYFQTNMGTNFVPTMNFTKPVNPIDINTSTLHLYNYDSGKYIQGTVTVAQNGLSATFAPVMPLLPGTAYAFAQSSGYYDMDGVYLNGNTYYFITGNGSDLAPPQVSSVYPVNTAPSAPLNAQVTVHFSEPINAPTVANAMTVTPSGGSAIAGSATLASDQVTLNFVPSASLVPNTVYTVQVSGYADMAGNVGATFISTFTTSNSVAPLSLSTGFTSGGTLSTTNNTPDANWTVTVGANPPVAAEVVGPGDTGWYSGWQANGPKSSWIALNPNSVTGNTSGTYSTSFNLTGYSLSNLCFVGATGIDDNGSLLLNGHPITGNISSYQSLTALNIALPMASLNAGINTLSLQWGSTDNSYEAFRLQGSIQTCGASLTGGLSLVSASPSNGTTGVATSSTITMNFNNPLDPATVSDTTLPVMVGWNSNYIIAGNWAVNGSQAVFTPDAPFPPSTQIYVGNCNGPYDTAGDTYNGCYSIQLLQFTTSSTVTAPPAPFHVTAFSPASGATNVGLRTPVTATFNRSFNPNTINQNSSNPDFLLYNGNTLDCQSYTRSSDNTTLQFNCYPLPSSASMTALIGTNLQDQAGNGVASFSSQFSTSQYDSNTSGSISTTRPVNGASNIGVNSPLTLYTSLPVNASTVNAGLQVAQNNVALAGTVQVLDNGYTIQFTPSTPFTPGALVQWWITSQLYDATYGSPFTTTDGYFHVAASLGAAVPVIQASSPANGANPVSLNSIFDVQFNTPLDPSTVNSTNIYVLDSHTNLHVAATYSMPQPNEVRIVPTSPVSPSSYIYIYVTTGLHSSTSVPAQANDFYSYTGTTQDATLPSIVSAVPYNGAGNVGVNESPQVVFSKVMDPVSVNGTTFQVSNAGTPLTGTYFIDNTDTRVTFTPDAPLPANTNLVMTINGVLDRVGHPASFTSHFQTAAGPDFQRPTVLSTSIPNNGTVPTNASLTIRFSESMDITTFSSSNILIQDETLSVNIPATLTWSGDQSIAYLTPTSPLAAGRQYYLYINSGTDLAGNSLIGTSYYFYAGFTSASTAPTVTAASPLNGAAGVGINTLIQAQFSSAVDPATLGNVTLTTGGNPVAATASLTAANTALHLVPAAPLTANTTYLVTIAGVDDPAGNLVSTVTFSFTTGAFVDFVGPSISVFNPPYNATVGTNVVPKFIFNEPLNPLTVNTSTFRMVLANTGQPIPVTVTLSADAKTVTLQPQIQLLAGTQYYFQACCGFQDFAGNNGNGANEYFYTGSGSDTTPPTVTINPVSGATGIPLNAHVLVSVNETIDPTNWSQSSVQLLDNLNNVIGGTVSSPDNQTLTFAPSANLSPSSTYTVKVANFTDASGNAVTPVSSTFTTSAAASTPGLTLISTNIPFGSANVSATQQIILTFSQILDPSTVNSSTLKVMQGWNSNYPLAGAYAVNGNQVTFTPTSPYAPGVQIYVGECGGPTDVLGEVFLNGSCYGQELVFFNVISGSPDNTALQVISVSPANNALNVGLNVPVSVTFNKSINPSSINNADAILSAGQTITDRGSVTMSADDRTMTFSTGALSAGTAYTISLPTGGVSDPSGNTLASEFNSVFTTTSYPVTGSGAVQTTSPTNNASGVPLGSLLTLYLNRAVNPSSLTGNFTVTVNGSVYPGTVQAIAGNLEVQFTPSVPFPNGAVVQWFFSNVLDVSGDTFSGTSGIFYMVVATNSNAAPQQIGVSPLYGSSLAPVNSQIDIAFSLPIDATTITAGLSFTNLTPASINLISPNVIRIVPTSLTPGTYSYVCTNTAMKGTNGTPIQGGCYSTYFNPTSTGPDTTPGTVQIGPPNSSIGVGTNAKIRLALSKPVDETTVNTTTVHVTTSGNPVLGTFSFVNSGGNITGINFTPANPLPPSSVVNVAINGLLDYAGNTFTPLTTQFTTGALPDFTAATVLYDFAYNTQNIPTNAIFTCRYTKPMDPSSFTAGNVYVYDYATSVKIPVTYTFSSDMMSVTLTPTSTLTPNTDYEYECFNAIDLTGNAQTNNGGPLFYTGSGPDTAGPQLVYANPPNGSTNVPLNDAGAAWSSTNLMLLFNEPLSHYSLSNITLTPQGGSPLAISTSLQIGDTAVVVQLPSALLPNTTYTYNVAGVTDYAGNAVTPATSTFTTGTGFDFVAPAVSSFVPVSGATNVSIATPLSITFTEPMDPVLFDNAHVLLRNHNTQAIIPTTFTLSADFKTVSLSPVSALSSSTIYDLVTTPSTWYLSDIAGNNYGSAPVSTFTTGP